MLTEYIAIQLLCTFIIKSEYIIGYRRSLVLREHKGIFYIWSNLCCYANNNTNLRHSENIVFNIKLTLYDFGYLLKFYQSKLELCILRKESTTPNWTQMANKLVKIGNCTL